jgi:hypothetical protein
MNAQFSSLSFALWQTDSVSRKVVRGGRSQPNAATQAPGVVSVDHQLLVHPLVLELSSRTGSGLITPEEMAKPDTPLAWARVEDELLPFIRSCSLFKLAEVLEEHPWLYWHPLVMGQVSYLGRLQHDVEEWKHLGWQPRTDEYGVTVAPGEVQSVRQVLAKLVDAHVRSLIPGHGVAVRASQGRRGPKSAFKNPHPTDDPSSEWVDMTWVEACKRELHAFFKAQRSQLKWLAGESVNPSAAFARITQLAIAALDHTDAAWWTGLHEHVAVPITPAPVSVHQPVSWRYSSRWALNIDDEDVKRMLTHKMGRAGRNGRPLYLAYAVLGVLLGAPPATIKDKLDNYRRSSARRSS